MSEDGKVNLPEMMKLKSWGQEYDTFLETGSYVYGGGLNIEVMCMEDGYPAPYTDLTVNLTDCQLKNENCAFVDTNNFSAAEQYIRENKLGKPTGRYGHSGYCIYPEYEFDMKEIEKHIIKKEQAERPAPLGRKAAREAR